MYISTTLPYTAQTLTAFITNYNQTIWPAHILAALLIALTLAAFFKPFTHSNRVIAMVLCLFWAWNGVVFYCLEFSSLNFLAPVYGGFFITQAVLLCALQNKLSFQIKSAGKWAALTILITSLLLYPLGIALYEQTWESLRLAGTTPLATSLFTLGLLCASNSKTIIKTTLILIPALHVIASTAIAFLLMQ